MARPPPQGLTVELLGTDAVPLDLDEPLPAMGDLHFRAAGAACPEGSLPMIPSARWLANRSYGVPISDTRSGRAVLPDLDAAKVAVAVSGLAPLLWLPSRLRDLDRPSHPVPAMPAHSTG